MMANMAMRLAIFLEVAIITTSSQTVKMKIHALDKTFGTVRIILSTIYFFAICLDAGSPYKT